MYPMRQSYSLLAALFLCGASFNLCPGGANGASFLSVVNTTGTNWTGTNSLLVFSAGVTDLRSDTLSDSILSALASDFAAVSLDREHNFCLQVYPLSATAVPESNSWPAFLAGMGIGFLWFGFGWILRLGKRIADF